jgi:DNA polymerase-3 subunit beta
MKFSISRESLLQLLQAVIGVVERRQTMPILSNILVVAHDDEVAVTATDLEVELVARGRSRAYRCERRHYGAGP